MKKKDTQGEYFVIVPGEDGAHIEQMTKEELLKRITPASDDPADTHYGHSDFKDNVGDSDPNYWGNDILIIKGEIVQPKAVKVVTKMEIE